MSRQSRSVRVTSPCEEVNDVSVAILHRQVDLPCEQARWLQDRVAFHLVALHRLACVEVPAD